MAVKNITWQLSAILLIGSASALGQALPAPAEQAFAPKATTAAANDPNAPPITARQRLNWVLTSTIGPTSLAAGVFSAGFSTARNNPGEYGPHWAGFGKRYGMRLTGISTGNAIEAGMGSLWGEDPRYFPTTGQSFKGRLKNVVVMTFAARRPGGNLAPAYARYMGNVGNNFLSNTWRADSDSSAGDAGLRIALGVAGRMGSNAFAEFWPTVRKRLFHRNH
jgi:hypothetical protein